MPLSRSYVVVPGTLPELFRKIAEGQAPSKFTIQHLKDIGFESSNHRTFIPLLKSLKFLDDQGVPTPRYHAYRGSAESKSVMAEALRDAYGDLFVIKARPSEKDKGVLISKFKSAHNVSDDLAERMYGTFASLLKLADLNYINSSSTRSDQPSSEEEPASSNGHKRKESDVEHHEESRRVRPGLYYNIQIHLPATKDIEVFNAIFKSLREHLID